MNFIKQIICITEVNYFQNQIDGKNAKNTIR